jgi:PIN domain nuclease of toxin-antitoxin system
MTVIVLDASALLALLKDEPGSRRVAERIADSRMSVVNYSEVVSHFVKAGMPPADIEAMLRPLPMTLVAADADTASLAGRLRAVTAEAGLSLGDRFCLALALREDLPAWTADKQWSALSEAVGATIVVIR